MKLLILKRVVVNFVMVAYLPCAPIQLLVYKIDTGDWGGTMKLYVLSAGLLVMVGTSIKATEIHFDIENRTGLSDDEFYTRMHNPLKYVVWKGCVKGADSKSFLTPTVAVPLCSGTKYEPSKFWIEVGNKRSEVMTVVNHKHYRIELSLKPENKEEIAINLR